LRHIPIPIQERQIAYGFCRSHFEMFSRKRRV